MTVFACCSSGRSQMLVQKTLKTLARGGFSDVLFVIVPAEETLAYTHAITFNDVKCMIMGAPIKGLVAQRKFFRSQMISGTEIVFLDDDIEAIKIKGEGLAHCTNLMLLAEYVFQNMFNRGCLLAGVYPMANRDWMTQSVSESAFVVGAMYFCVNKEELKEPDDDSDSVEDWARCLQEISSGRPVLRFNNIGIQTKYFNPKAQGGIPYTGRMEKREIQLDALVSTYPDLVKKIMKKSMSDLKFLKKPTKWVEATLFG